MTAAGTVQDIKYNYANYIATVFKYSFYSLPCTCTLTLKVTFPAVQRYSPLSVVLTEHSSNTETNSSVSLTVMTWECSLLHEFVQELSLRIGPVELLQTILLGVGEP